MAVLVRWVLGLALVGVLAVTVVRLPDRTAEHRLDAIPTAGADSGSDVLTCERTLPDVPTIPGTTDPEELEDAVQPQGRVTSGEIVECPDLFDGRPVEYVGEIVGDVLHRDGGAWVLMNDDAYALETGPLPAHRDRRGYNSGLSVWLAGDVAALADEPGRADRRGDVLRVEGVVHRVDPADGGGLTIRAFSGEVLAEAVAVDRPVNTGQVVVAVVLAALAAGLWLAQRRAARDR